MKPQELKAVRDAYGLSPAQWGVLVRSDPRTVRRWEVGDRRAPGPALQLYRALSHKSGLSRQARKELFNLLAS